MSDGVDVTKGPAEKGANSPNSHNSRVKKIVGKIRDQGNLHRPIARTIKSKDKSHKVGCLHLKKGGQHREESIGPISLEIWNTAYDDLRNNTGTSGLVQAYESIISQELPNDQKQGMNTALSVHTPEKRLELMTTIATAGVEKGLGSKASQVDESARKILDYAKETIGSLLSEYRSTPLAWAGFCTLTPLLLDPLLKQEDIKDGLFYVAARISRFMSLSQFLIVQNWDDAQDFRNLQDPTRRTLRDLYRKVLEFEMNSVCAAASAWNIAAKNVVDWHGWRDMIDSIREIDDLMSRDIEKHGIIDAKWLYDPANMDHILAAEVNQGNSSF